MSFIFGNLDSEISSLLSSLNTLTNSKLTSIDQLRSGQVLGRILASYLKREKIEGILQGSSKEIWQCNWEIILSHTQALLPEEWKSIRAYEIISDSGLLLTITKLLLKKFTQNEKKIPKRSASRSHQSHQGLQSKKLSIKSPSISKVLIKPQISESLKEKIHAWLIETQVLPPSLYLHEFIYRIRTGISLADLINRLEGRSQVIHGIHKNPKTISYCIGNINKTLEHLRKISKVNSKYLWCSAEICEGSEEHIYGLLSDIREFYLQRYPNFIPRSGSVSKSRGKSTEKFSISLTVTNAMKRSIIQWVNSLGLERFVVFHSESKKDYFFNGVLLCEVVGELLENKLKYTIRPQNDSQCVENFNAGLKLLKSQKNIPRNIDSPSEEITWTVLWELMNNNRTFTENYDSVGMKGLEESLISWIDSFKLLPERVTKILEIVPNFRNGVLLCQLVSAVLPHKSFEFVQSPQSDHAALQNIRKALTVLRKTPEMSQKFTWKDKEIHLGCIKTIFGLLEDLHKYSDGLTVKSPEPKPYLGRNFLSSTCKSLHSIQIPPQRNLQKTTEIEEWLSGIGVNCKGLAGEVLGEFKSGEKLCEIVSVLERKDLEGVHCAPKTTAAALANIRKVLDFLYKKPAFDSKFMYLDDQVLSGNGKVIRSLLSAMKKIYKNRLIW